MSALAPPDSACRTRDPRGLSPGVRWLMVFPAVALLSIAAELVYLGVPYYVGPDAWRGADLTGQILWSLGVLAWNASVPVALAALLSLAAKRLPRGMPVAAVTCLLFSAAVIAAMILLTVDDSSTGVLLLLFLPVELLLALGQARWRGVRVLIFRGCGFRR